MFLVPFPGGLDDCMEFWVLWLPTKLIGGLLAGADKHCRVSRSLFNNLCRNWPSGNFPRDLNYLFYRVPIAIAQVIIPALVTGKKQFQCQQMRLGQIENMNIVPDTGSIVCQIVIPKNIYCISLAERSLKYQRNQVGLRPVILSQFSVRISACSVKIS